MANLGHQRPASRQAVIDDMLALDITALACRPFAPKLRIIRQKFETVKETVQIFLRLGRPESTVRIANDFLDLAPCLTGDPIPRHRSARASFNNSVREALSTTPLSKAACSLSAIRVRRWSSLKRLHSALSSGDGQTVELNFNSPQFAGSILALVLGKTGSHPAQCILSNFS